MKVSDLMTAPVFTLNVDDTLGLAEDLMNLQRIRHIPVVDREGVLVGLVTHRDLLKASVSTLVGISPMEQHEIYESIPVREIMRTDVLTVDVEMDLGTAAQLMMDNRVGCLPVVCGDKLVGILTDFDFLRFAVEFLGLMSHVVDTYHKSKKPRKTNGEG